MGNGLNGQYIIKPDIGLLKHSKVRTDTLCFMGNNKCQLHDLITKELISVQ